VTTAAPVRRAPIAEPRSLFPPDAPQAPRRTLEATILATLDERRLRGTAACVVCGDQVGASGECPTCGSSLD
jgi:hypothetical protein